MHSTDLTIHTNHTYPEAYTSSGTPEHPPEAPLLDVSGSQWANSNTLVDVFSLGLVPPWTPLISMFRFFPGCLAHCRRGKVAAEKSNIHYICRRSVGCKRMCGGWEELTPRTLRGRKKS